MVDQDGDDLVDFLDIAHNNAKATALKNKLWFGRLRHIDELFIKAGSNLNQVSAKSAVPSLLLLRGHGAFRGAARLATATQTPESYALSRSCLEYAGYAVMIMHDEKALQIWKERDRNEATLRAAKNKLTWANAKNAIHKADRGDGLKDHFQIVYERCITFGGHPNSQPVLENATLRDDMSIDSHYFITKPLVVGLSIATVVQAGYLLLRAYELVFPERSTLLGINQQLDSFESSGGLDLDRLTG